jgi:leader peptidase (prepilin peptidase)/N-methyltransferase
MPASLVWVGVVLGGIAGLLVSYLSDVLPVTRSFSQPYCYKCTYLKAWGDYLLWKRCRTCYALRYWGDYAILVFYLISGALLWIHPSRQLGFWAGLALLIFLGVVFVIDVKHRLVLHPVSLFGAAIGLAFGIWKHGWLATLGGGAAGFVIMLGLYYLGDWYARWMARRRGQEFNDVALGFGDVNLSGIMGLLLGWPGIFVGLLATILIGGLFSLAYLLGSLLLRKYQHFMAIPYAPFLVLAIVLFLYII